MSLRRTITHVLRRAADAFDSNSANGNGRRWPSWAMGSAPARQQLATRYRDAARGNWLAASSPSGNAIAEAWAVNLGGDGPSVRSGHSDEAVREALEDEFAEWGKSVDVEGMHDLAGFLLAAVRSIVMAGEAVVQFVTTSRGELRLRLLSPEQLDPAMNREIEDLRRVIAGVEFSLTGERVAYHVFPRQPDLLVVSTQWEPVRIPAEDICHLFVTTTPGQVRGRSWFAPVATRLEQLDRALDALGERINVAAMFAAFVTDPSNTSGFGEGQIDPQQIVIEPGTIRPIPADASVTFPNMPSLEGTPEFLRTLLREIASGVGMPFELLSGDFSQTNYSAAKMAMENFKRRVKALRATLLDARLLRPIWQRWITLEALSGRMALPGFEVDPRPYLAASFLFPDFASLDPYKESAADVALLNAGIRSRAEIIASRGRDIADVDAEFAADNFVPRAAPAQITGSAQNDAAS